MRILVIHPGALGDVLLALPALTQLKATFPGAELTLAAEPRILSLFRGTLFADRTVALDALDLHECFADSPLSREAKERLSAHDGIISWFGSHDPIYRRHVERLGARILIAPATPPPGAPIHASQWLLETLEPWGISSSSMTRALHLPISAAAAEEARAWAAGQGLSLDDLCLVHPGSGARAKCWPTERFAMLVSWIETALGGSVVLIEGPADQASISSVLSRLRRMLPVARDFPLPLQAALVAEATLFIGNDSGLTHLAAAVGAPTIALFGPTDPAIWAPLGPHVSVVRGAASSEDPWAGLTVERIQSVIFSRWQSSLAVRSRAMLP